MPNMVTPKLSEESYDALFRRFINACSYIAKQKQVEAAKAMIVAVEKEWKRRRTLGDASPDFERPEVGMLAVLGYHVGQMDGKPLQLRKLILKYILEGELPMVHSASYTEEWGEPNSSKRYEKLVRFLQNSIESNKTKPDMKSAVKDWSEDLKWIEDSRR